jgi:hypothetical protein
MGELVPAVLQRVKADRNASTDGPELKVQFNPASLKLQLSNRVDEGATRGRQVSQFLGRSSTEISFDLVFDTADEAKDASGTARSVRERTAIVEQFVLPQTRGNEQLPPPRVRFHWGDITIIGVISSLTIDFDLFSSGGIPLRAKMGVSIREQDPRYEFLPVEGQTAAGESAADAVANALGGLPGANVVLPTDRTDTANDGESAADFLVRNGLDPALWRSIAGQLDNALAIPGGTEVDFASALAPGTGFGARAAVEAGAAEVADVLRGASSVLGGGAPGGGSIADAALRSGVRDAAAALGVGQALSAAGGVVAAIERAREAATTAAVTAARAAFAAPAEPAAAATAPAGVPRGATATNARGSDTRLPLRHTGVPGPTAQARAAPVTAPPRVDPRASSFGLGVPLRAHLGSTVAQRTETLSGGTRLRPGLSMRGVPLAASPSVPPWEGLPVDDRGRRAADRAMRAPERGEGVGRAGASRCGCGCSSHECGRRSGNRVRPCGGVR